MHNAYSYTCVLVQLNVVTIPHSRVRGFRMESCIMHSLITLLQGGKGWHASICHCLHACLLEVTTRHVVSDAETPRHSGSRECLDFRVRVCELSEGLQHLLCGDTEHALRVVQLHRRQAAGSAWGWCVDLAISPALHDALRPSAITPAQHGRQWWAQQLQSNACRCNAQHSHTAYVYESAISP